jgi:hypothetical protein
MVWRDWRAGSRRIWRTKLSPTPGKESEDENYEEKSKTASFKSPFPTGFASAQICLLVLEWLAIIIKFKLRRV